MVLDIVLIDDYVDINAGNRIQFFCLAASTCTYIFIAYLEDKYNLPYTYFVGALYQAFPATLLSA